MSGSYFAIMLSGLAGVFTPDLPVQRFLVDLKPKAEIHLSKARTALRVEAERPKAVEMLAELIRNSNGQHYYNDRGARAGVAWEALRVARGLSDASLLEKLEILPSTTLGADLMRLLDQVHDSPHLKSAWLAAVEYADRMMLLGNFKHAAWAYNFALDQSPFRKEMLGKTLHRAGYAFLRAGVDDRPYSSYLSLASADKSRLLREMVDGAQDTVIPLITRGPERLLRTHEFAARMNRLDAQPGPLEGAFLLKWKVPEEVPKLEAPAKERQPFRVYASAETRKWLDGAHGEDSEAGFYQMPSFEPLIFGNRVYFRSPAGVHGADLLGNRLWVVEPQTSLQAILSDPAETKRPAKWQFDLFFTPKFHGNRVTSPVSTDGERLYFITDAMKPKDASFRDAPERATWLYENALVAASGGVGWELWRWDGSTVCGSQRCRREWNGGFFLGPPLVIESDVYAAVEVNSVLHLLCLDAKKGDLKWSRSLGKFSAPLSAESQRRTQGVQFAQEGPLLVIATNSGSVVLFDLFLRRIRWVVDYQTNADGPQRLGNDRWGKQPVWRHASAPEIADNRVVIAPPDSREVRCYDLEDGRLVWKREAKHDHFLAGVYLDRVLLAGNYGMRALSLSDGSLIWYKQLGGAEGRGFLRGRRYLLPVRFGRLMEIDTTDGANRLVARFEHSLGNILSVGKFLVSQTEEALHVYQAGQEVVQAR